MTALSAGRQRCSRASSRGWKRWQRLRRGCTRAFMMISMRLSDGLGVREVDATQLTVAEVHEEVWRGAVPRRANQAPGRYRAAPFPNGAKDRLRLCYSVQTARLHRIG